MLLTYSSVLLSSNDCFMIVVHRSIYLRMRGHAFDVWYGDTVYCIDCINDCIIIPMNGNLINLKTRNKLNRSQVGMHVSLFYTKLYSKIKLLQSCWKWQNCELSWILVLGSQLKMMFVVFFWVYVLIYTRDGWSVKDNTNYLDELCKYHGNLWLFLSYCILSNSSKNCAENKYKLTIVGLVHHLSTQIDHSWRRTTHLHFGSPSTFVWTDELRRQFVLVRLDGSICLPAFIHKRIIRRSICVSFLCLSSSMWTISL